MSVPGGKADENDAKADLPVWMSAVGGRADLDCQELSGPLIARSRHSDNSGPIPITWAAEPGQRSKLMFYGAAIVRLISGGEIDVLGETNEKEIHGAVLMVRCVSR